VVQEGDANHFTGQYWEPPQSYRWRNAVPERDGGLRATFHFAGSCQALTAISTSKGQERTASGIGKGSQLRTLRAKLKGEHCTRSKGRVRSCHLGSFQPGRVVTDFSIDSKGRVSRVLVGRVID
jgi:hypothetical protein